MEEEKRLDSQIALQKTPATFCHCFDFRGASSKTSVSWRRNAGAYRCEKEADSFVASYSYSFSCAFGCQQPVTATSWMTGCISSSTSESEVVSVSLWAGLKLWSRCVISVLGDKMLLFGRLESRTKSGKSGLWSQQLFCSLEACVLQLCISSALWRNSHVPWGCSPWSSCKVSDHTAWGESHMLGAEPGSQSREVLKPSRSKWF